MAKGKKTGGRVKGTPNKTTSAMKDAVIECFNMLGGVDAFYAWAKTHKTDFYVRVAPRLIPNEVTGGLELPEPFRIELTDYASPPPDAKPAVPE